MEDAKPAPTKRNVGGGGMSAMSLKNGKNPLTEAADPD